jgi:hypothetical protein
MIVFLLVERRFLSISSISGICVRIQDAAAIAMGIADDRQ